MKKLLFSLTFAVLAFTGCAGKGGSSAGPAKTEDGKTVIRLAYVCSDTDDDGRFGQTIAYHFNQQSSGYEVELTVYTNDYGQSAFQKLSTDIVDGKTPDVVYAQMSQIRSLYDRGYLADLGGVMDEYDGIKRDEMIPAIIGAITLDGDIPAFPTTFNAETAVISTEQLGEELTNWNFEQAINFYNDLSDDEKMKMFPNENWGREKIANYFITGAVISCVDYRELTFDPEKGLRQALEFIDSLPEDTDKYYNAEHIDLVSEPIIWFPTISPDSGYSQSFALLGGKDISIVGFPTENGAGALVWKSEGLGIMENSPSKQGAWDLINYLATDPDSPCSAGGCSIPFRESDYLARYDADPAERSSINYGHKDVSGIEKRITDVQKQQLKDYIAALDVCCYRDTELESIIREECAYVINGERTPEQCIEILNDRVGTYLAENK